MSSDIQLTVQQNFWYDFITNFDSLITLLLFTMKLYGLFAFMTCRLKAINGSHAIALSAKHHSVPVSSQVLYCPTATLLAYKCETHYYSWAFKSVDKDMLQMIVIKASNHGYPPQSSTDTF